MRIYIHGFRQSVVKVLGADGQVCDEEVCDDAGMFVTENNKEDRVPLINNVE